MKCEVQVGYAIGVARPVSLIVDTFGTSKYTNEQILEALTKLFNFAPRAIKIENITDDISFWSLAEYVHLGRTGISLPWARTNKAYIIKAYMKEKYGKQDISIRRFYQSDKCKVARAIKIISTGDLCEKCGAIGTEVYHKIHLIHENVTDHEISLNQDNLMLLCNVCHKKEHGMFKEKLD